MHLSSREDQSRSQELRASIVVRKIALMESSSLAVFANLFVLA
jgi:hypothetical protein